MAQPERAPALRKIIRLSVQDLSWLALRQKMQRRVTMDEVLVSAIADGLGVLQGHPHQEIAAMAAKTQRQWKSGDRYRTSDFQPIRPLLEEIREVGGGGIDIEDLARFLLQIAMDGAPPKPHNPPPPEPEPPTTPPTTILAANGLPLLMQPRDTTDRREPAQKKEPPMTTLTPTVIGTPLTETSVTEVAVTPLRTRTFGDFWSRSKADIEELKKNPLALPMLTPDQVKTVRTQLGLSRGRLAEEMGVSRGMVWAGESRIGNELTLLRLTIALRKIEQERQANQDSSSEQTHPEAV
ncbi:MAG: hypothetical protein Q8R11_03380 [bacterium]|nr:hypothetical protein [bacterium]